MFWLVRSAVRSAGRAGNRKAEPKPPRPPSQAGPLVAVIIVVTGIAVVIIGVGRLGPLAMLLIPVILGLLILGGILVGGAAGANRANREAGRRLSHVPVVPSASDEARKTALMRAQAAGWRFSGDTATLPLPKPPQVRPEPAVRGVTTRRRITLDAGDDARLLRVAAILVQPCPFCGVGEGELCKPVEDYKWYALDGRRGIYAHPMRIARAVSLKSAKLEDVTAQFDDKVPDQIWSMIL